MHARIGTSPKAASSLAWSRFGGHDNRAARGTPDVDVAAWRHDHDRDEARDWRQLLDRYLEGWAEANPAKIFAATAHGYRFDDPFVGRFSRWEIGQYLERLREKFERAGASEARDFVFSIQGPMDGLSRRGRLMFFREAPGLGLTGTTFITIGENGVMAEAVAYDLNLALDVLRVGPGVR